MLVTVVLIHIRLPFQYCGEYHPTIRCIKATIYPQYWRSYLIFKNHVCTRRVSRLATLSNAACHTTFFKHGPADPSQQCKRASNNIQDPLPCWFLMIFELKFGGGNLFSLAMTIAIEGNNYVGSLLEPLLKKVTPQWAKECYASFYQTEQYCVIPQFSMLYLTIRRPYVS